MIIRSGIVDDLEKIDLQLENLPGYSRQWQVNVTSGEWEFCIAEENGRVLGFGCWWHEKSSGIVWITRTYLRPDANKKEVGGMVIDYMVEMAGKTKARTVISEIASDSPDVEWLNQKGFRECGYNDRYFHNDGQVILKYYSLDLR